MTLRPRRRGFTLVELLVVLSIIGLLLAVAAPRYFRSVDKAREATLKANLSVMRDAIDKYYGDNGRYPQALEELVEKRYLRGIPVDPITESERSWIVVAPKEGGAGRVWDVRSGAEGRGANGTEFAAW